MYGINSPGNQKGAIMDQKNEMLTMVVVNGFFLVGKLEGLSLHLPRIYSLIEEQDEATRKMVPKHKLAALPTIPLFITLTAGFFSYPIPLEEIGLIELWERVTNPAFIKAANQKLDIKSRIMQ